MRSVASCTALVALMVGAIAAPAQATGHPPPGHGDRDGKFSCRASALRVTLLNTLVLEPVVANSPNVPCMDDSASLLGPTTVGPVTAEALSARTDASPNGGHAESSVARAAIAIGAPLPVELPLITAEVLTSEADVTCKHGKPVFSSSGTVARVTIGEQTVEIPANGAPVTVDVLGIAKLYLNRVITTPDSITRRALQLTVPGVADVVIAESIADVHGKPCQKKPPKKPECSDGKDNDGDGKTDKWDRGCWGPKGYNPKDNSEKH